jgi:hypothetical protein
MQLVQMTVPRCWPLPAPLGIQVLSMQISISVTNSILSLLLPHVLVGMAGDLLDTAHSPSCRHHAWVSFAWEQDRSVGKHLFFLMQGLHGPCPVHNLSPHGT